MPKKLRKRRYLLFDESPNCRRCGIETILPEELAAKYGSANKAPLKLRERMATIEHLNMREHNKPRPRSYGPATTLWCFKCNNGAANAKRAAMTVERQRRESGRCGLHGARPCLVCDGVRPFLRDVVATRGSP